MKSLRRHVRHETDGGSFLEQGVALRGWESGKERETNTSRKKNERQKWREEVWRGRVSEGWAFPKFQTCWMFQRNGLEGCNRHWAETLPFKNNTHTPRPTSKGLDTLPKMVTSKRGWGRKTAQNKHVRDVSPQPALVSDVTSLCTECSVGALKYRVCSINTRGVTLPRVNEGETQYIISCFCFVCLLLVLFILNIFLSFMF